ncbi:hypothetical protein [Streptomyces sp. cg40]|uniref:hypothetical protein n=1 Tax=Streptomyces sp. cg40 TaxID=3419764 RepID=UPI003D089DFF
MTGLLERAGLGSRLVQRLLRLGPPPSRDVTVHRDLPVPLPDGTVLLADRWTPREGGDGLPTALIRTPYGRRGPLVALSARPLAERGFQVVVLRHQVPQIDPGTTRRSGNQMAVGGFVALLRDLRHARAPSGPCCSHSCRADRTHA